MHRFTPTLILSIGLTLALVILSASVLVGVISGDRDLTESAVRILTVGIAGVAGALGYEMGKGTDKDTNS